MAEIEVAEFAFLPVLTTHLKLRAGSLFSTCSTWIRIVKLY
jgi:hypothetical protein